MAIRSGPFFPWAEDVQVALLWLWRSVLVSPARAAAWWARREITGPTVLGGEYWPLLEVGDLRREVRHPEGDTSSAPRGSAEP